MSGSTLKPWNKLVRLREDVRSGELSLQEFAADLFDVVNRTGKRRFTNSLRGSSR
jgi:hypothetical protein